MNSGSVGGSIICERVRASVSVYANTFRSDLIGYLKDNPTCKLLIPQTYYAYFREYVYDGPNLYTIPCLQDQRINIDLRTLYAAHIHGSIFNRLQLPLASTLSTQVIVLGFDGRTVQDQATENKYWWANSEETNYTDLTDLIFDAHPYMPDVDKDAFAFRTGEMTEKIFVLGEQQGKKYYSLHESSILALQNRQMPASLENVVTPQPR